MKNAKPDKNTKSEAAATTQTTTADVKNIDKDQIIDLYANGIKHIHVYSMNKPDIAEAIRNNVSEILG